MKHQLLNPYLRLTLFSLALLLGAVYWPGAMNVLQHLGWLALLFVFFCSFFCWVFISCWRLNEVWLKRVDYLWLALVCGAVVEVAEHLRAGSLQWPNLHFAPLLLVLAVALRVARVKGEIHLKTPRDTTLWLVVDRQLIIPMPNPLLSRDALKARLLQMFKQWSTRRYSRVFVRIAGSAAARAMSSADLVVPISPGLKDCEFELDVRKGLADTPLAGWIAAQSVHTVYLFGVMDLQVLEALVKWGEQVGVEIFLDNGNSLRFEQEWRVDLTDTANAALALKRLSETVEQV
ncbi:hypothetical protein [Pseudomonas akapageensis]|uniref:hypothetical protein n=1 Tax=Pseudomonas akapageensis TaxID=2609961 RepID=UPI00140A8C83|nr:hypothetical protein [Pseudomonas akapageensis]